MSKAYRKSKIEFEKYLYELEHTKPDWFKFVSNNKNQFLKLLDDPDSKIRWSIFNNKKEFIKSLPIFSEYDVNKANNHLTNISALLMTHNILDYDHKYNALIRDKTRQLKVTSDYNNIHNDDYPEIKNSYSENIEK